MFSLCAAGYTIVLYGYDHSVHGLTASLAPIRLSRDQYISRLDSVQDLILYFGLCTGVYCMSIIALFLFYPAVAFGSGKFTSRAR